MKAVLVIGSIMVLGWVEIYCSRDKISQHFKMLHQSSQPQPQQQTMPKQQQTMPKQQQTMPNSNP